MRSERLASLPQKGAFSVFFTAGFPRLKDTRVILSELERGGVHMVEIGFPFSDPTADGPTIQASSYRAIENGMTVSELFDQLSGVRDEVRIPILLMGYINPVEQFGFEHFLQESKRCGVDALIIPDMPFEEYQSKLAPLYRKYGISPVFLVTTRTPDERIRRFDAEQPAFLYVVSSEATTGGRAEISKERDAFFERLSLMGLSSPLVVGFGVADKASFDAVTRHTRGAIVGSAFVRAVAEAKAGHDERSSDRDDLAGKVRSFVEQYR